MSLTVDHIHKTFGASVAVDDVSFTVQQGSVFGFLGTNGAGKATTMRVILDILRPDSGSVTWSGVPNTRVPRQAWGYLPEERGLYPKMTVEDHLLYLAPLVMPTRVIVGHPAPWEVAVSLALLALAVVGMLMLAARVYRVGVLLYGERVSLRRVWQLSRTATVRNPPTEANP